MYLYWVQEMALFNFQNLKEVIVKVSPTLTKKYYQRALVLLQVNVTTLTYITGVRSWSH